MKSIKYRERILNSNIIIEQSDVDHGAEYPNLDMVETVLDEIEGEVRDVLDILSLITGLSEIDEAKEKLQALANDLY